MNLRALGVALLSLAVLACAGADYVPWPAPITNISTPSLSVWDPQVNASGHVVWHGSDGNDSEVYYWDGSSKTNISNHDGHADTDPHINASGHVVWVAHNDTDDEIWHWDGSGITDLTGSGTDAREARISDNGDVVWVSSDADDHELWRWDGSSSSKLTDNEGLNDEMPEINANGDVVWRVWDQSLLTSEVWYWDGVDKTNLSGGTGTTGYSPQISDSGHAVWTGGDNEIYHWNGSSGSNISNRDGEDYDAHINASGHVVWTGFDTEGYYPPCHIYYWDGSSVTNISAREDYDEMFPRIDDSGWVAWLGGDAQGRWQVFAWDGAGGRYQLTDDPRYHYGLRITNGYITWYTEGAEGDVYFTDVRDVPEPGTAGLVAVGLLGLVGLRRRRKGA
jgi:hypothetical protein